MSEVKKEQTGTKRDESRRTVEIFVLVVVFLGVLALASGIIFFERRYQDNLEKETVYGKGIVIEKDSVVYGDINYHYNGESLTVLPSPGASVEYSAKILFRGKSYVKTIEKDFFEKISKGDSVRVEFNSSSKKVRDIRRYE